MNQKQSNRLRNHDPAEKRRQKKRDRAILTGIIAGAIAGVFSGMWFGSSMASVAWLGILFLNALKMVIVPLVMLSMITGIASLGSIRKVGSFGVRTLVYYMATTSVAVFIGLLLVNWVEPGAGAFAGEGSVPERVAGHENYSITQVLTGFISPNIFRSMANMEILPLIFFSLLFGGILSHMADETQNGPQNNNEENGARKALRLFETLNEAIMRMVHLVLYFAPIGIFGLIAGKIAAVGWENFQAELGKVAKYALTVIGGLAIHGAVVLPLVYRYFTGKNPLLYVKNMLPAIFTAFSTASSSATLPLTIECAEENNRVRPESAGFVLPIGATINMDGTALYEAVAAVFIAQLYGIDLTTGQQAVVFLTASLAAIGAAGIPEAGLVTMALVLKAVGLPLEGIGLLLAIDWFLDRFRTSVNVLGDAFGAGIMEKYLDRR